MQRIKLISFFNPNYLLGQHCYLKSLKIIFFSFFRYEHRTMSMGVQASSARLQPQQPSVCKVTIRLQLELLLLLRYFDQNWWNTAKLLCRKKQSTEMWYFLCILFLWQRKFFLSAPRLIPLPFESQLIYGLAD